MTVSTIIAVTFALFLFVVHVLVLSAIMTACEEIRNLLKAISGIMILACGGEDKLLANAKPEKDTATEIMAWSQSRGMN